MIHRYRETHESEKFRIQRNRESEETEDTQEEPCAAPLENTVQEAVSKAIADKSTGDPLFKFCRALKGFQKAIGRNLDSKDLDCAFACWWNFPGARANVQDDLPYDETLILFHKAFRLARTPLGLNVIDTAVRNINAKKPPRESGRYDSPRLKRLVHLCFELQLLNQNAPFFLGCRDAAKVIGCSPIYAAAFLEGLVRDSILILVAAGQRGRASRYRFNLEARKDE